MSLLKTPKPPHADLVCLDPRLVQTLNLQFASTPPLNPTDPRQVLRGMSVHAREVIGGLVLAHLQAHPQLGQRDADAAAWTLWDAHRFDPIDGEETLQTLLTEAVPQLRTTLVVFLDAGAVKTTLTRSRDALNAILKQIEAVLAREESR